jgi:DNA-binding response OmpR family regulator
MKRVLIVDDSLELGRWLQAALTQLDAQIQAPVYPSAEEAMLEATRHPVDVLVTDIRLPGMTGFELVRKMRKRYPGIKVIFITGLQDAGLRKQAEDLGAEAFFHKPMDIPSFLNAVNACLSVERETVPTVTLQPQPLPAEPAEGLEADSLPAEGLVALLSTLRASLTALAALVLDSDGKIVAKTGHFPDSAFDHLWIMPLVEAVKASNKVSRLMETPVAKNILAFQGVAFDLVLASIGDYALVLVLRSGRPALRLALAFEEIMTAQKDLLAFLNSPAVGKPPAPAAPLQKSPSNQGISPAPWSGSLQMPEVGPTPEPRRLSSEGVSEQRSVEEVVPDETSAADFDAIFQKASPLKAEDVDAFWDSAASAGTDSSASGGISYDQARQMGLASGLEEEKH